MPCLGGGILLWLPAGGGGGTLLCCGGGGGVVFASSSGGGGGGGDTEVCSACNRVPHSGQNFWLSSTSAPQLLQNVMIFQTMRNQGLVKKLSIKKNPKINIIPEKETGYTRSTCIK
jgi:hypothetical protein